MIPKSKIKAIIGRKYTVRDLDSRSLVVIGNNPKADFSQISSLLESNGVPVSVNNKSAISVFGEIMADKTLVVVRPKKIQYKTPTGLGSGNNPAVTNRLSFAHFIHQTMQYTTKPFNIIFAGNKRVELSGITNIKFLGEGIADLRIMKGNTPIRVTVNRLDGVYHTMIEDKSTLDIAHDVLVKAAEGGLLSATVDDNDYMELYQPVVFKAPRHAVRKLITDHIRGGVGIVGNFNKNHVSFDGNTNTLTYKCDRVFKTVTDMKPDDEPHLVISNSPGESLFDIKGLTVDLIPKREIPENSTLINT